MRNQVYAWLRMDCKQRIGWMYPQVPDYKETRKLNLGESKKKLLACVEFIMLLRLASQKANGRTDAMKPNDVDKMIGYCVNHPQVAKATIWTFAPVKTEHSLFWTDQLMV